MSKIRCGEPAVYKIKLRGFNKTLNKWIQIKMEGENFEGMAEWYDIDPESIGRSTGKNDISGKEVYEGDFIESHQGFCILDILMQIRYGTYEAYCPADRCYMDNIGFFVEAAGYPQMPVGPLGDYAKIIGNTYENAGWLNN